MRHARLFTYVMTNNVGEFKIVTIRPRGYPNSDLPAHIHIAIWKDGQNVHGIPGELLFDDDERLTPDRKQRSVNEGFLIAKNTGTVSNPVYSYHITMAKPSLTLNDRLVNFILPLVERNLSRQWISQWFLFLMI
jgi:protocatechuate 3,4-dioxygenase beta subunit